jgi:hypothetical protein
MDFLKNYIALPFLLGANPAQADSFKPDYSVLIDGFIAHEIHDVDPLPQANFNEAEGIKFIRGSSRGTLPNQGDRVTVDPSSMSGVGRIIGIKEDGTREYRCALTVINPPDPFHVNGNGNDIAVTAAHCAPSDHVYGGNYVGYEGLFIDENGTQITVPIESIHYNQTLQNLFLAHLPLELKEQSLPHNTFVASYIYHRKLFDTAIVQFAESLPDTIDSYDVIPNSLNNVEVGSNINLFGYPGNTRGLTTDPDAQIGEIAGTMILNNTKTNNGSSGGIVFVSGHPAGVHHGGLGKNRDEEITRSFFHGQISDEFTSLAARIDTAAPYINAPFLERDSTGLERVQIAEGTQTYLIPNENSGTKMRGPILNDEDKKYLVLDRQLGFVGVVLERASSGDESLFYVREDSVINPGKDREPDLQVENDAGSSLHLRPRPLSHKTP